MKESEKLKSWKETHFEVVQEITLILSNPIEKNQILNEILEEQGHCGLYDLAEEITDSFEKLNDSRIWDGEFLEEIVKFTQEYIKHQPVKS